MLRSCICKFGAREMMGEGVYLHLSILPSFPPSFLPPRLPSIHPHPGIDGAPAVSEFRVNVQGTDSSKQREQTQVYKEETLARASPRAHRGLQQAMGDFWGVSYPVVYHLELKL